MWKIEIALWDRGQISFLTKIIKIKSPSGGKLSGFVTRPFKGLEFPNLGVAQP